ncbi:MAG: hypothetical protein ACRERC_05535 [Candidatus Binatia bacterium]
MATQLSVLWSAPRRVAFLHAQSDEHVNRQLGLALPLGLLLAAPAHAAPPPLCSWPIETTGVGITNIAYPDTDATYWTMAFDSTASPEMRITGEFPSARFMSFTVYDAQGGEAAALVDEDILPDPGSSNPFTPAGAGSSGGTYALTVLGPSGTPGSNTLLLPTAVGYVVLRVYVPDEGLDREGGVALPQVVVVAGDGSERTLPACSPGSASAVGVTK